MRTTDEPEPFKGLGKKVEKPAPAPASSSPPVGKSGIVTDAATGYIRTTSHKPPALTLEEAIWHWQEHYASDMSLDFLP